VIEQHTSENIVSTVYFEVDLLDSVVGCVSEPAADDMSDLIGCRVGHEHRIEANALFSGGRDDGRCGLTVTVEPEQLREVVSRAWSAPRPLTIGGLPQSGGGVRFANPLQESRHSLEVLEANQRLFTKRRHPRKLRDQAPPTTPGIAHRADGTHQRRNPRTREPEVWAAPHITRAP
jgi:hypothetical protein